MHKWRLRVCPGKTNNWTKGRNWSIRLMRFRRLKQGPSEWNLKVAASLFILAGAVTLCRLIIGLLWKNFPIGLFVGLLLECSLETWRPGEKNYPTFCATTVGPTLLLAVHGGDSRPAVVRFPPFFFSFSSGYLSMWAPVRGNFLQRWNN